MNVHSLERSPSGPLRSPEGQCPFGLCEGSGFVFDEDSNTAYDCRCRPQRVALAKARSLSAVIPRDLYPANRSLA